MVGTRTAPNVSRDPNFAVYRWARQGVQVFQLNTAGGDVISTFSVGKRLTRLPFGSYAGAVALVTTQTVDDDEANVSAAAGQCPCSATVVYDDGQTRIVVVYDSQGSVIKVITITYQTP